MRTNAALTGIGILLTTSTLVASPAVAEPRADAATRTDRLTVFMMFGTRDVLDLGEPGVTVGDITTGTGPINRTLGGRAVGDYVYRAETVRVDVPGGSESRLSTIWVNVPGGSLAAMALLNVPSSAPPTRVQRFVIIGGTGDYAGASGTMTLKPIAQPRSSRLVFRFVE